MLSMKNTVIKILKWIPVLDTILDVLILKQYAEELYQMVNKEDKYRKNYYKKETGTGL